MVQLFNSGLLLALAPAVLAWKTGSISCNTYSYINYTTVTGFFLQDEAATNPSTFNYVSVDL